MPRWDGLDYQTRFWLRVEKHGPDQCWPWLGAITSDGYGHMRINGKMQKAHRLAYVFAWPNREIPQGMELDHLCHTRDQNCKGGIACPHRCCCNPDHLEPVTPLENSLRGQSPWAQNARQTECINGHPFTPDNIYRKSNGGRDCRKCNQIRAQRRNKAAVVALTKEQP